MNINHDKKIKHDVSLDRLYRDYWSSDAMATRVVDVRDQLVTRHHRD